MLLLLTIKANVYNIFKTERYYLISYGVKIPSKNFYSFRFLKRKAFEIEREFDEYEIDLI